LKIYGGLILDKIIEDINKKFGIHFEEKGDGQYAYFLPGENILKIDLNTKKVDAKNWYGGANTNGPWDKQPRNEQGLEGLIHNLISINEKNKDNWRPPY
jgi:hypothetical protein